MIDLATRERGGDRVVKRRESRKSKKAGKRNERKR